MESIWTSTVTLPHFPSLDGDIHTDVLVIGSGMAGLLCAYYLQQAGVSCVVAEANTIAGGVTKNTTAKITSQHGLIYNTLTNRFGREKAGLYLQANEEALASYASLCQHMDCSFTRQDHFVYSTAHREKLEAELAALIALHYPAELVTDIPLPFPTLGAVKFPNQAQFHPLQFLSGLVKDLSIYEHTPIREIKSGQAIADKGTIRAKSILVTTHFPFLNTHGSYFLKMYQQRSYAIALQGAPLPGGMYLDEKENGLSFRSFDDTLILGGGGHRTGKTGGNWKELEDFAALHYPGCTITHRWATQDCMTLDGMPYIGRYSALTPNLYVATGFNKWGMTTSMVAARLLTDLITGKGNPYQDLFSPSRSMLHLQLGLNALEAAKSLLTPGKKRCPHLGCALKWNPQERSWDCPCHGSRFTEDGRLIDNPATGDLEETAE